MASSQQGLRGHFFVDVEPIVLESLFRRHALLRIVDEAALNEGDGARINFRLLVLLHVFIQ